MIPGSAVYHVVEAMAPLYTAAVLGYASVRWLKAFSDEKCKGINHFVALYAVPVLIFHMVSTNDPYHMNQRLIAADTLQKAVMLLALTAWAFWSHFRRRGRRDGKAESSPIKWVVTNFSVASLPNTIIMGVPLLNGIYGSVSGELMKQIVVMQFCIWYNVVIFLYEFMAAQDGTAKSAPPCRRKRRTRITTVVWSTKAAEAVFIVMPPTVVAITRWSSTLRSRRWWQRRRLRRRPRHQSTARRPRRSWAQRTMEMLTRWPWISRRQRRSSRRCRR